MAFVSRDVLECSSAFVTFNIYFKLLLLEARNKRPSIRTFMKSYILLIAFQLSNRTEEMTKVEV